MDERVKRGGKRKGAGRKRRDTEAISVRLRPETAAKIRNEAERRGCTLDEVVERLVETVGL